MTKLTLFSAAIAVFALFSKAQAQSNAFTFDQKGGGFYVTAGVLASNGNDRYSKLGLDTVYGNTDTYLDNPNAQAVMYPKPSASLLSFGIGGYGVQSGIIFGGEVNSYLGSSTSGGKVVLGSPSTIVNNGTLKASHLGADVLATIGIVAYQKKGLVIYPQIGLGYGGMFTQLSDSRDNRQYPTYVKSANKENVLLYNTGFTVDGSLGIDYYLGSGGDAAKGFRIGIRGGYRFQAAGKWSATGGDGIQTEYKSIPVAQPAKLGSSGAYIKLVLGLGKVGK